MSDKDLIEAVAQLWIDNGGDAEGLEWTWRQIRDRIAEIQEGENG